MPLNKNLYLVDKNALSSVLLKTIKAKELLETKKVDTISEAIKIAGISRGAFYKYKDLIKPFYDLQSGKKITFFLVVEDLTGVLSNILNVLAKENVNILTINQSIPIDKIANITITIDTFDSYVKIDKLIEKIEKVYGVKKINIVLSGA